MEEEAKVRRTRPSKRRVVTLAVLALGAGALVVGLHGDPSGLDADEVYTLQPYGDFEPDGAGTRARATGGVTPETKPRDQPEADAPKDVAPSSKRYAVKGPSAANAKKERVLDAPEFNMFGMVGSGSGGGGIGTGTGEGFGSGHGRLGGHAVRVPRGNLHPADDEGFNREGYAPTADSPFFRVADDPRSTFSVDVDTASYSNARRFLRDGSLPPRDSVRVEEWLNYFTYGYAEPSGDRPFSVTTEVSESPFDAERHIVRIGIQGKVMAPEERPPSNLVFLLDVSGSMESADKLPLLQRAFTLLTDTLRPSDTVSIVVYAGASGLVLPPTSGARRGRIREAIEHLSAGGSTNGAEGIELAYQTAERAFKRGGTNRVILATDGDFNVGVTSDGALTRLVEDKRKSGVFLTVLGFGRGNLQDAKMELLADKGNGNYAYIDSLAEARKVLVSQAGGTLVTIAKDVKIQVELNPRHAEGYRLLGYENRMLAHRDFRDDRKDAGEIGAGHSVTALYEVVPKGRPVPSATPVAALKYQSAPTATGAADAPELMTVRIRYKAPDADVSTEMEHTVSTASVPLARATVDHRFAVAVASAALVARDVPHTGSMTLARAQGLAETAVGVDPRGERAEFVKLVGAAARLRAVATRR